MGKQECMVLAGMMNETSVDRTQPISRIVHIFAKTIAQVLIGIVLPELAGCKILCTTMSRTVTLAFTRD